MVIGDGVVMKYGNEQERKKLVQAIEYLRNFCGSNFVDILRPYFSCSRTTVPIR